MCNTLKEPQLVDFYDSSDPRGCSSSEYSEYLEALAEYRRNKPTNTCKCDGTCPCQKSTGKKRV